MSNGEWIGMFFVALEVEFVTTLIELQKYILYSRVQSQLAKETRFMF